MRKASHILFLVVVGLYNAATAGQIDQVTVSRDGKSIVSVADFVVDAPRNEVVKAFSSFAELEKLNPAILESRSEPESDGRQLVTTRLRDCVAMFCRTVTLVERVEVDADGTIRAEIAPDSGDFKSGSTVWTFVAAGDQTRVSYRSTVEPDFWLPPLLGPRAMRRALKRQITASSENVERHLVDAR